MSKLRRGGARLEKNPREEKKQPRARQAPSRSPKAGKEPGFLGRLSRPAKIAMIVVAALLAVILILLVWYKNWAKLPDLPDQQVQLPSIDPVTGELASQNPMINSSRKKGFYTFLVVGQDTGGGGNTDTMMLGAYDIPNQKLSVMSLPRDTMVDARHPDRNRKLNGVWNLGLYYAGKDNKKPGVEYLKEAIGDMIGFTPDFYVTVKWEAFGRLVNALGGVEFDVPYNMVYNDPTQNLHINVQKGKRVLTGQEAMGVVRWRSGYANGDLGRIQTQQAFMKEVVKKCLKIENVTKINQFAEIFTEEVDTDLTLGNLVAFAERAIFGGLTMDNVVFVTMPNTPVYVGGVSYVQANAEELLGVLNESFNPYVDDLDMEVTHILQYSSSKGYYTYSGTGTGTPPTYSSPKPAPVVNSKPASSSAPTPQSAASPSSTPNTASGGAPNASGGGEAVGTASPADPGDPSAPESSQPSPSPDSGFILAFPSADPETAPSSAPAGEPAQSSAPDEPPTLPPEPTPVDTPSSSTPQPTAEPSADPGAQPAGIPMD